MSKQSNINAFVKFVTSTELPLNQKSVSSQLDYELERIITNLQGRYEGKEKYKSDIMAQAQAMIANKHGDVEGAEPYDADKILRFERQYTWADEQQGVVEAMLKMFMQAQEQLFPEAKDRAKQDAEALSRAEARFG